MRENGSGSWTLADGLIDHSPTLAPGGRSSANTPVDHDACNAPIDHFASRSGYFTPTAATGSPATDPADPAPSHSRGHYERDADGALRYVATPVSEPTGKPGRLSAWDLTARSNWFPDIPGWGRCTLMVIAWLIDTIVHLGSASGVYLVLESHSTHPKYAVPAAILTWALASFLHRTAIQRLTHTTFGKALFNLRLHNPADEPITYWQLVKLWFTGIRIGLEGALNIFAIFG